MTSCILLSVDELGADLCDLSFCGLYGV